MLYYSCEHRTGATLRTAPTPPESGAGGRRWLRMAICVGTYGACGARRAELRHAAFAHRPDSGV
jgi:hypothetical protein